MQKIFSFFIRWLVPIFVFAVSMHFVLAGTGSVSVTKINGGVNFAGTEFTGHTAVYIAVQNTALTSIINRSDTAVLVAGNFSINFTQVTQGSSYTYNVIDDTTGTQLYSGSFVAGSVAVTTGTTTPIDPGITTPVDPGTTTPIDPSASTGTASFNFSITNPVTGFDNLPDLIVALLNIVMLIMTPIVGVMLMYTGFLFVTAGGDLAKLTKARSNLLYVIIGAAIILGAKVIATAIQGTVSSLTS